MINLAYMLHNTLGHSLRVCLEDISCLTLPTAPLQGNTATWSVPRSTDKWFAHPRVKFVIRGSAHCANAAYCSSSPLSPVTILGRSTYSGNLTGPTARVTPAAPATR